MNNSELRMLARAVESAVFQSLLNAQSEPERESYWRSQADKLDNNFKRDFGKHYAVILYGEWEK